MKTRSRVIRVLVALVALVAALALGAWATLRHGEPVVVPGDADALARRMLASVDAEAWGRTLAVRWTFADGTRHLWDRARSYERFDHKGTRVLLDLSTRRGLAWRGGVRLGGAELARALDLAWRRWINDSFWLNPVVKVFDDGVVRSVARDDEGRDALLVSYRSGGVTPGDRYLWLLDANGRPRAWRMWVSVMPVGGMEASWEAWTRLSTGAWVATRHHLGVTSIVVRDVAGAGSLAALEPGADPFEELAR